ncbi:MAG: hypothetical protein MZV64_30055 [Ignavibacteriales bacterium]|nr:hypothetical protein [Ignavibacteriales bacterium]
MASGKLAAKDGVVVAEFDNRTADSTLGASVSEALRIDLSQSPVITVLGAQDMAQTLARMGEAGRARHGRAGTGSGDARQREGRDHGGDQLRGRRHGAARPAGLGGRRLRARGAARDRQHAGRRAACARPPFEGTARAHRRVAARACATRTRLEQVSTGSLEALRFYTEGMHAADVGRYDEAIGPLRRAVAADSTFAMAWRKLAAVLGNARLPESERIAAASKAYQYRDRLPEIERHLADAFYFWAVDYDPERVVARVPRRAADRPDERRRPQQSRHRAQPSGQARRGGGARSSAPWPAASRPRSTACSPTRAWIRVAWSDALARRGPHEARPAGRARGADAARRRAGAHGSVRQLRGDPAHGHGR